jgi:TolB-like protein
MNGEAGVPTRKDVSGKMTAPMDPTHPDIKVPDRIGRYVDLKLLGRGGMGAVYGGRDPELDRPVAIKVMLHSTPDFVARFRREAQSIARLTHGNVVQVFDFGVDDEGNPYFVMELVDGTPLDRILLERGRLPAGEAIGLARQAALGLAAAHRAGIIHRDVKPSNLIVDSQGTVKLVDFGIARATASAQLTTAASLMGTPGYMSPEQAQGKPVDHRADIYALGLTLFEMLAGEPPFYAEDPIALVVMNMQEPLPDLRQRQLGLPEDLILLVEKMAQKSPADRIQSCDEVVKAFDGLGALRSGAQHALSVPPTNVRPLPEELAPPASDPRRRGIALALGAALAVSGIGVGAVVLLTKNTGDPQKIVEPAHKDVPTVNPPVANPGPQLGAAKPDTSAQGATKERGTTQMAAIPHAADGPLRVAVLQFKNLSGDKALDELSLGIGETATTEMAGAKDGPVRQKRAVFVERTNLDVDIGEIDRAKDEHFDKATVAQLGKLEGVDVAVVGSYQKERGTLRVTARFVRVQTGEVIEVARIDGHKRQTLALQDELATQLSKHLNDVVDRERPLAMDKGKSP